MFYITRRCEMKFQFTKLPLLGLLLIFLFLNQIWFINSFAAGINLGIQQQNMNACLQTIPVYPNVREASSIEIELGKFIQSMETMSGISGGEVSAYLSKDQPDQIIQFYLSNSPKGSGWELTMNLTTTEEGGILIWKKESVSAQVLIAKEDQNTIILLGCSSPEKQEINKQVITFSEEDGLADRSVMGIAVSSDDIAWIATRSGLSRFDGKSWLTLKERDGLPSDMLTSVVLDGDGLPWVGTDQWGCAYFDGASWNQYQEVKRVSDIAMDEDGDIWFAACNVSVGGVYHFNGQDWVWHKKKNGVGDKCVNAVSVGNGDMIWAATKNGLSCFDGKFWKNYTIDDGLADNDVNDVAVDRENKIWAATDEGVSCFDGRSWFTYTDDDGLIHKKVKVVEIGPDGSIWLGTVAGLSCLKSGQWYHYTEENGLPSNRILSLFADHNNNIWIGTPFDGLAVLSPESFFETIEYE